VLIDRQPRELDQAAALRAQAVDFLAVDLIAWQPQRRVEYHGDGADLFAVGVFRQERERARIRIVRRHAQFSGILADVTAAPVDAIRQAVRFLPTDAIGRHADLEIRRTIGAANDPRPRVAAFARDRAQNLRDRAWALGLRWS